MRFNRLVGERYGPEAARAPAYQIEGLVIALNEKNAQTQIAHIDYLKHLSTKSGTVHFADTLGEVRGEQILRMVPPAALDAIDQNFDHLREPDFWHYRVRPDMTFAVGNYSLAPRPTA